VFVITVHDPELTTVRGVALDIDTALHHRDLIVESEYADLPWEAVDGDPLHIAILGDDEIIAEVTVHAGVAWL